MIELLEDLALDEILEEDLVGSPIVELKGHHRGFHRVLQREIRTRRVPQHNHSLLVHGFRSNALRVVRIVLELGVHAAAAGRRMDGA
jgi:hypothetical protein